MKKTIAEVNADYALLLSIADKKLPVKLAYAISKNIAKLEAERKTSEAERIKLCERYAKKDENGEFVLTKSVIDGQQVSGYQIEDEAEFAKQLQELLALEVEIDLMQVPISVLDQLDSDRYDPLTPAQIHDLTWMINED